MNKYSVIVVLIICFTMYVESRGGFRGGGFRSGGYRSSSSSRSVWRSSSSSRRSYSVATSRPSYSYSSGGYSSSNYGASSSRVATSKPSYSSSSYGTLNDGRSVYGSSSSRVSTSKPSYGNSNDWTSSYGSSFSNTPNKPTYVSSNNARRITSSSRNIQTTPRNRISSSSSNGGSIYYSGNYGNGYAYNNRGDSRYNQSYGGGSSGTKKAVLAGLGGSALGLYLGYQLGSTNGNNKPYFNTASYPGSYNSPYSGSDSFYPKYSVVHHYHHGDRPIVKNAKVNNNAVSQCDSITFCMPNTQPLCLTNGTVYCLAPMSAVRRCSNNATEMFCVNTTLTAPCLNATDTDCNAYSSVKNVTAEIPCVTNLYVFGDFATGQINVSRSFQNSSMMNVSSVHVGTITNNTSASHATNSTIPLTANTITNSGIMNEFCVSVIADPIEPEGLSNAEYVKYLREHEQVKEKAMAKFRTILDALLHHIK